MAFLNFSAFPDSNQRNAALEQAGPNDVVASGWVPPDERDATGNAAHAAVIGSTADLMIAGASVYANVTKVCLWDCWKPARPEGWNGVHQITGSCVGAGGGNALFSLAAADVVKRRDPERVEVPFWLLPYGVSRMLGGMNDRGEGSFGSTFADAIRKYGHVPANTQGLPPWKDTDGLIWGEKAELDWSQGKKIPETYMNQAKPYLVKSTAICQSADDVREAIKNFYAVTCASNWGGQMRPGVRGSGANAALVNSRVTTWNHQMSVHGWWDNPELGELFYIMNQWGLDTHGRCPSGAPPGGFWVKRADMDYIVRQGETFALSQFDGFPGVEQPLDFSAF